MKFYSLIFLILLFSCKSSTKVEHLSLFNGISEITKFDDNCYVFLANLKEYNNIMSLCYVDKLGQLLRVYPIDKYSNVDINSGFIKLVVYNQELLLIYENRVNEIVIETFNKLGLLKKYSLLKDKIGYGTFIQFGDGSVCKYIKSSKFYDSTDHSNYEYNFFILKDNFEIINKGMVNLGEFLPAGMKLLNHRLFYYIDDKQLFYTTLNSKNIESVYSFESDIVAMKPLDNKMLILLYDSIYIVSEEGELSKGFKLLEEESNFSATSILNCDEELIIVEFKSESETIYKTFTLFGSQKGAYKIDKLTTGEAYIIPDKDTVRIIYSVGDGLYLIDF